MATMDEMNHHQFMTVGKLSAEHVGMRVWNLGAWVKIASLGHTSDATILLIDDHGTEYEITEPHHVSRDIATWKDPV